MYVQVHGGDMNKFNSEAQGLLTLVGGKTNIISVSHCVTRMRFVLEDAKKADVKAIEKLKSVKGTFTQSGQFQVIIGNDVIEFYNEFILVSGIRGDSKETLKKASQVNQTWLQRLMGNLGEIFAPLIPALIVGGLILGFRNCIDSILFFENGTKSLTQISQFWSGVNHFLWLIGEAVFHFLPVGIVWSITRKMGTTQILGIILGITLVSPQLLNAYGVAGTQDIPFWDFGYFQIEMIGYQAQVIPAILAGFVLVYIEKFFRKITPNAISMIVVPFFAILLSVIIAHTVVGPIGWVLGDHISTIIYSGLTSSLNWLFAGIFGFFYAPLVITGLHHMSNAIDTQLVASFGGTILWPMIALSNIAQGSAVLAMIFLQKKNEDAKQISIPACISCYLGVTEPALFGVNLKYTFPFFAGMTGSAIAAIFSVATQTKAASIGVGGIPGILSILPQHMFTFFIAMLIAIFVPFVITFVIGKKKLTYADINGEEETLKVSSEEFGSIATGEVIDLSKVEDKTFSEKLMGDGFAIVLQDGEVVSPCTATVKVIFPTKHAIGLELADGTELLIHIGMDTVELNGNGFETQLQQGDIVKKGDLLVKVDLDYLKENNKSVVTPVIFTNQTAFEMKKTGMVNKNETILKIV